ncbi:Inactive ubiquitin carboxyl-terminal hydrolase MINDY-4B [Amphibalanus amphitrite]|uniref:Ubiquitin carboxyl-terminal hydrolase MINDY n=1 Tax=Amphibalanus amphitrite TaxID=1232801 RepID=A0A6A4VDD6_AMPAM|nr:Inactive ubiquitin carboxyl-terminal hydrolase MINDY-4B [Amphibalanus amphitrite]
MRLRQLVFGASLAPPRQEWLKGGFTFQPPEGRVGFGLQTPQSLTQPLVMAVQTRVIKHLLFQRFPSATDIDSLFRLRRCDQLQGLASALSDVIWGARAGGPAHVCLCSEAQQVWGDTDYLSDGVTERFESSEGHAYILLLYSLVLTRGINSGLSLRKVVWFVSLPVGTMASGGVVRLSAEHIPSLVSRLASYGALSLQTRTVLRLLRARINPAPFRLLAAGTEGTDLVTVTAMEMTPGRAVLDVCGPESAAGRRRLDSLLRAPELAELWRRPVRVEYIAGGLADVFQAAAESHGLRRVVDGSETYRLFLRPDDLPDPPPVHQPGLEVRSLEERHLSKVENHWWHNRDLYKDVSATIECGHRAGLAVGVFLTERDEKHPDTPLDEPVSWSVVNAYGAQSFGYTEEAFRGRSLQVLVLQELVRRSRTLGLPCFGWPCATMASGGVVRLSAEHIPSLVSRLASYGALSLQTRTVLRLLRARINPAPFRLLAAGTEGADLVTVTAMEMTPGRAVLDVCGPESAAGRRRLDSLLRAPELAELWRRPVRVELMAEGLADVLQYGCRFVTASDESWM